jgi:DNA-binding MarR family transcriptional regulator
MNDNLDFCLTLHHAHAGLQRKLDDQLGNFHGIGFGDFALLDMLARSEEGRLGIDEMVRPLGQSQPALVRRLVSLEKIGLVERAGAAGRRQAVLRPVGNALVQAARDTVMRVCNDAVGTVTPAGVLEAHAALRKLSESPTLVL